MLISQLKAGTKILTDNLFFFKKYKELNLEKPEIKIDAVKTDDGYELKLNTDKFAKDVCLSFEDQDGFFEDNYFDLFPGEVKKVKFQTNKLIEGFLNKLKIISLINSY